MNTRDLDQSLDLLKREGVDLDEEHRSIQQTIRRFKKEIGTIKNPLRSFINETRTDEDCVKMIKRHPERYRQILNLAAELYLFNQKNPELFSYYNSEHVELLNKMVTAAFFNPSVIEYSVGIHSLLTNKLQALKKETLEVLPKKYPEKIQPDHPSFMLLEKNFETIYLLIKNQTLDAQHAKKIWPDLKLLNTARLDKIIKGELAYWEQIVVGELEEKYPHKIKDVKQTIFNILTFKKEIQGRVDNNQSLETVKIPQPK